MQTKFRTTLQRNGCNTASLGLVDYLQAATLQEQIAEQRLIGKIPDTILFLEHPPVITIGMSSNKNNILASSSVLSEQGISIVQTDRGGNVTYHGPGQLVCYVLINLKKRGGDIHHYVHDLEEVVIKTLTDFSIKGNRDPGYPGVWVGEEKICALGIKISKWITKHGFALNVNNNLKPFSYIYPCGISTRGVTSMSQLLGHEVDIQDVISDVTKHFADVFGFILTGEQGSLLG